MLGVTETREAALALVEKYQDPLVIDRSFDLARTDAALGELGATDAEAQIYARLAGALIYADPANRAASSVLLANRRGQSGLWRYGISGDIPIALLRISDPAKIQLVEATLPGTFLLAEEGVAGRPGHFSRRRFGFFPSPARPD